MPQQRGAPGPSPDAPDRAAAARPDASMWLLNQVMDHTLDEGYEEEAARRAAEGRTAETGPLRPWLIAGTLLIAMVITLGAAQARSSLPAVAKERRELIDRIESGTERADRLQEEVDALRDDLADREREALREEGGEQAELTALLAGAVAVTGPGLEIVVDDAESVAQGLPDGARDDTDTGRVRDRDLQRIVNGLWASGAEAVAVNGRRLTALSAIRHAGEAILVDNRPLVPPYTIRAVGDGPVLRDAFEEFQENLSSDLLTLEELEEYFGIQVEMAVREELRLPASAGLTLRTAEPLQTGEGNTP
ncbi:DUF881 domain-containing protein [Streptomyces aidingensis]